MPSALPWMPSEPTMTPCACGCGELVPVHPRYVSNAHRARANRAHARRATERRAA